MKALSLTIQKLMLMLKFFANKQTDRQGKSLCRQSIDVGA